VAPLPKIARRATSGLKEGRADGEKSKWRPLPTSLEADGYEVVFTRRRWNHLHDETIVEEPLVFHDLVRMRETEATVTKDGRLVARVAFTEYDAELISPWTFYSALDNWSASSEELATILLSEWSDLSYSVTCYGRVVEVQHVWLEVGHSRPRVWQPVLRGLLDRVRRYTSVIVAKAFPLEYEGSLGGTPKYRRAFERRRRAMIRYYGQLGLTPLPGPPGRKGWLWRPRPGLEEIVEAPEYVKDWTKAA
jgi:hypothetical protein